MLLINLTTLIVITTLTAYFLPFQVDSVYFSSKATKPQKIPVLGDSERPERYSLRHGL